MKKMKLRAVASLLAACSWACSHPAPTLDRVEPGLLCDEQLGGILRLEGDALEPAAQGALEEEPTLLLPSVRFEPRGPAQPEGPSPMGPVEVDPQRLTWIAPGVVELQVDGALGLTEGSWDVVVSTRTGHQARLEAGLTVLDPPQLDAVQPARICHEIAKLPLSLAGAGFLLLEDGAAPAVTVDAAEAEVMGGQACQPLAGEVAGQLCEELELELAPGSLGLGSVQLELTNPAPAACRAATPLALEVVLAPEIEAVHPEVVCSSGGSLRVTGGPFVDGLTVDLGAAPILGTTVLDAATLEIELGPGAPLGPVDLALLDPSGCVSTLPGAFTVVNQPQAFQLSPPVVPAGRALTITALLADVHDDITRAWLVDEHGEERAITWSWSSERASELVVDLPADLHPGRWQLGLEQAETCSGLLAAWLEVVETATVAVESVDPPHAWIFDHTALDIATRDPLGAHQRGFEEVPGVYLLGPAGQERSYSLLAVRYHDEQRITAVVPPELEAGDYDLLVVNPDGAYGLLGDAMAVVWDAPPSIDEVSPASLEKASEEIIEIHGASFRDPTVDLLCREGGTLTEIPAVVESSSYGSITASLSTRGFAQALCVVRVSNSDGTTAQWSALSITNPAQNLFPFEDGPALTQARRAPAAAAGRTTSVDRWVYAIGGDGGDASSALDSVEAAPLDAWGAMDAWATLPDPLPTATTLAQATTIGSFVYLVGGDDGAGPVGDVRRAMVLDPLDVPWVEEVSLDSLERGLEQGRWTYRVSALFDGSHPANPDGESLAGEPVSITLPSSELGWAPRLCWTAVDEASGYRIYRSPEADAASNELGWLVDTTDTLCFQDEGDSVDSGLSPLPEGSLGSWSTVASLDTPRSGACLALTRDPVLDPELFHVYVAGGRDASGAMLDSIEVLHVTVESSRHHSVSGPTTIPQALSQARWLCGGFTVDDQLHSVVDGETWVFFAGGSSGSSASGTVDRGLVVPGGELDSWDTARSMSPARAGFAQASASDFLYAFGGQQNAPSTSSTSAELRADGGPSIRNWNSLGDGLSTARWLPGSAQESAVILVIGGQTDSDDATASTELTHY
jgi:hypothetical protein